MPRVVLVVLVLVAVVTGGKQSQLRVRLTWTGILDWSLTTVTVFHVKDVPIKSFMIRRVMVVRIHLFLWDSNFTSSTPISSS